MKECFKCHEVKPLSEFYKHSGMADDRLGKCKECVKADVRANYSVNRDYYKEYERERGKKDSRKETKMKAQKAHRLKYPERYKARTAVGNALRDGRLTKQQCEVCGRDAEAHHDDYSKLLEVRWFCRTHHFEHHEELRSKQ